jgi:hypothetical protein
MVFENGSVTKLWFYKPKKTQNHSLEKKKVMSGVSKAPKRLQF